MIPHIDPKVDYAFKKIFGSEANAPILLDLLNAVLNPPPERRIIDLSFLNPFNDKDQVEEKLSVVDVKARDQQGRLYNVEMQMCASPTYPERVLYYWAKIYAGQLSEGDDYYHLHETISISFLDDVLFPETPDFHLDFRLRSGRHAGLVFSDRLEIHLVELPKFGKDPAELVDSLEAWCYFLKNAADLDSEALPAGMQKPAVQKAMEVLTVIAQTDLEREKYEATLRWERDRRTEAKDKEKAKAAQKEAEERQKEAEERQKEAEERQKEAEEAARKAEKQGIIARIHLCQRLLKMPETPPEELVALPLEDLRAQAAALEKQVIAKP
jgi:predicted transposase/invertase (TIGR01784 family)